MNAITEFTGNHRWLSNFWPCDCNVAGLIFPSSENAYQAAKCANVADVQRFMGCTAGQAKRLGKQVKRHHAFDSQKIEVMRRCLAAKFSDANPDLCAALLATSNADLIEGNTWNDTFWGVCNGVGENWLGKLLMERRTELQAAVHP